MKPVPPSVLLPVLLILSVAAPGVLAQLAASPAAGPTPVVGSAVPPEGFVMMGGKVYVVRGGQALPLEEEMVLRVSPTGITGFDQVPRILTNEHMLTLDGRVVPVPAGIVVAPPLPKPDPADARFNERAVQGENTTGLAPRPPTVPATARVIPQGAAVELPPATTPAPIPLEAAPAVSGGPAPGIPAGAVVVPPPATVATETVTTTTTVIPPPPARGANVPGAAGDRFGTTVFDPNQVNDGSIEAAGTGTRRSAPVD